MGIILWLLFGALIGWLGGVLMHDQSGLVGNIIIGILGSMLGGWIASYFFHTNFVDFSLMGVVFSVLGAVILIFLKQLLLGKR